MWDYELRTAAYDPALDEWRPLPDLPLDFSECYPSGAVGEGVVFAWHCGRAALLDLANDSWQLVKGASPDVFATPVAAGRAFLFVGAYNEAVDESAWAYRPGTATATSEPDPTTFVPEAEHHGQRDALPLTFPDGSRIVLSYPGELRLAELGVQPTSRTTIAIPQRPVSAHLLLRRAGPAGGGQRDRSPRGRVDRYRPRAGSAGTR